MFLFITYYVLYTHSTIFICLFFFFFFLLYFMPPPDKNKLSAAADPTDNAKLVAGVLLAKKKNPLRTAANKNNELLYTIEYQYA
mmetsp:Transcript_18499/g.27553  ORF Transcript_18499/g.27553 Transcript_18499/m.27553 type:complete len:84 (+) Transcript_18499:63-314(+)